MKFKEPLRINSIDSQGWIYVTHDSVKIGDSRGNITIYSFCDKIYNSIITDNGKSTNTGYIYINGDTGHAGVFSLDEFYRLANNIE